LENETNETLVATTPAGVQKFTFSKKHFLPALRTPVGLKKMNVTKLHDYVAKEPYENIDKVMNLSSFKEVEKIDKDYWEKYVKGEFERSSTHVTVVRRVNPYSPAQSLIAFNSQYPLIVSDLFHAMSEANEEVRKAITVLLNSIFSLAYIFSGKEETTGRYMDIRQYDLHGMRLFPYQDQVRELAKIYEKYKEEEFPSLRKQLDIHYDTRYESFWARERGKQIISMPPPPIEPHPLRLRFDLDVVKSLGSNLTKDDILKAYEAIVWDMIITRGLRKN
jgi:hypothetical protein